MSAASCARILEVVDPGATPGAVDGPPLVLPHQLFLDGQQLPDDITFEGCDIDFGRSWPLTVTMHVPQRLLRYVATRFLPDGTALGGRVWVAGVEVFCPDDPISYPSPDADVARVDVNVAEMRFGAPRHVLLD